MPVDGICPTRRLDYSVHNIILFLAVKHPEFDPLGVDLLYSTLT
jgi:hypothetical protein